MKGGRVRGGMEGEMDEGREGMREGVRGGMEGERDEGREGRSERREGRRE